MNPYDPMTSPDPEEWMAADEGQKIGIIERWHEDAHIAMPSVAAHASIHTIVENQLALGSPPEVREAMDRLLSQGLDRHEAIHAIGAELTRIMYRALSGKQKEDLNEDYIRAVKQVTAETWRSMSDDGVKPVARKKSNSRRGSWRKR